MANMETDTPKKIDTEVSQSLKHDDLGSHGRGRCGGRWETFVHTIVVAIMILAVWGLIIVSAASPYFPRDYEVCETGLFNCSTLHVIYISFLQAVQGVDSDEGGMNSSTISLGTTGKIIQ